MHYIIVYFQLVTLIKTYPIYKTAPLQLRHLKCSKQLLGTIKERGGADLSHLQIEFQVTEQPLYLLVTQPGIVTVLFKAMKPRAMVQSLHSFYILLNSLSGTTDKYDLWVGGNTQNLDFCTVKLKKGTFLLH